MSRGPSNLPERRMLPNPPTAAEAARPTPTLAPARQLQDMPRDELRALAEEFGLDPNRYLTPQHLVAAVHERRQLIAAMDREAMLEVVKWGRRPVPINASREQLAQEIVRIKSMQFGGLSQRGLNILARLRGIEVRPEDDVPALVRRLKRQEGIFAKLNRKRRSMMGSLVSRMIGDDLANDEYQFLPPQQGPEAPPGPAPATPPPRSATIKEEIEESGLLGGIAGRIKRSADAYVNQKLDEIEARIDRKLDEIDRRLAEWRDKEIANRIRILKITLWASVIVAVISLLYSWFKLYFVDRM